MITFLNKFATFLPMFNLSFLTNPKKRAWKRAQNQEFSWWRGIASNGYKDNKPEQFVSEFQKSWMIEQINYLDKPLEYWKDKTIVEFGPGPAGLVEYVEAKRKYGVEPLIEKYKSVFPHLKNSSVEYISSPAENCDSIPSNVADLSICFNVLDHTFAPEKVLKQLLRVTKPNGEVLFQLNVFGSEQEFKNKSGLHAELHPHSFTKDSVLALLAGSGLKVLKYRHSEGRNPEGEFFLIIHLVK